MAGIYIHIPFCKKKCFYCNFYSINQLKHIEAVEKAIISELSLRRNFLGESSVKTIYFGGGTPTLMGIAALEHIIEAIYSLYAVDAHPEITIEANPDDLTLPFAKELQPLCNRLSIGIQSFNDEELTALGRQHNAETAKAAIANVRAAGFENISLDLIYGISSRIDLFQKSVETVLSYRPEHISAYALTYELNTVLSRLVAQKKRTPASEDAVIEQYQLLTETLKNNGYQHYEISNFSLPHHPSLHNSNYWNETPYLGVGPAAHSFAGNLRQWNTASIEKYVEAIQCGTTAHEEEQLTEIMQLEEFVMLRLRTAEGLSLPEMTEKFGASMAQQWAKKAQKYLASGDMLVRNNTYRLSEPSFLISDAIIADLV